MRGAGSVGCVGAVVGAVDGAVAGMEVAGTDEAGTDEVGTEEDGMDALEEGVEERASGAEEAWLVCC